MASEALIRILTSGRKDFLYVLQSRPITTLTGGEGGDIRSWYEFIELLRPDRLTGLDRNRALEELAGMIRQDVSLKEYLDRQSRPPSFSFFSERLAAFKEQFPAPVLTRSRGGSPPDPLVRFLLTLADRESHPAWPG